VLNANPSSFNDTAARRTNGEPNIPMRSMATRAMLSNYISTCAKAAGHNWQQRVNWHTAGHQLSLLANTAHFARYIATGVRESHQVQGASALVIVLGIAFVAAAAA
jgi:hypothetical protein